MSMDLEEDHVALRDGAARFAENVFGPARLRSLRDRPSGRDGEALGKLAADGWLTILAPEDEGGAGQGLFEACLAMEALGRQLASVPATAAIAAADALARHSSLRPAGAAWPLDGASLVLPALTAEGCTAGGILRGARDGAFELDGTIPNVHAGAAADYFLVEAASEGAPVLAIVAADAPGLTTTARRVADGSVMADLTFSKCAIDAACTLTGAAASAALVRLREAIAVLHAAELLGLMDAAIARTLEHLKTREQFGRPLGSFQSLQFRLADLHMDMSLTRALTYEAARLADAGAEAAGATIAAAFAKAAASAIAAARAMVQLHGAMGFTDEHDAGLFLKRALTLTTACGNAASARKSVAARLLRADGEAGLKVREDTPEDVAFRAEVRAWIDANLPKPLRHRATRPTFEEAMWWHRKLYERGWVAPGWPKQYGGMEASVAERIILFNELARMGAPEISGQAIGHVGPIIQKFGTPEQKARHLPGMLSGEKLWCQGYSEPSSGSDLASLRTRAVRDGDHFVVNGQKIWTTWGHYADWMFALVRTNPDVRKQAGITFLLIDMKTPGITPRPIHTITGEDEFAEVFFDDVRVPVENVVGEIDNGWTVATALLEHERLNGANPMRAGELLEKVRSAARRSGMIDDPAFADRLTCAAIDFTALCAAYAQIVRTTEKDVRSNADFAFAKLVAAELQQELCELLMEALGPEGPVLEAIDLPDGVLYPGLTYLQNRRATIYGGTVEIQRLLLSRRVLGLK